MLPYKGWNSSSDIDMSQLVKRGAIGALTLIGWLTAAAIAFLLLFKLSQWLFFWTIALLP